MEDNRRLFLIVLDSVGIGEAPDAAQFGDEGSNTVRAAVEAGADLPTLRRLGLFNIDGMDWTEPEAAPIGAFGRMREASMGKDTTIGHWEIAGVVSPKPLPTFPDGFPPEIIRNFEKLTGRKVICNKPYSGTQLLLDYGREHVETGALMVYTSADSVFQVAANVDVVPLEELYSICEKARGLLHGKYACGRVIARPYVLLPDGQRVRTSDRRDYSVTPPEDTMLDLIRADGGTVYAVGKIHDIFNGKGITKSVHTVSNDDGVTKTIEAIKQDFRGLIFTNLVDFDSKYGHRRNPEGYGKAIEEFDVRLPEIRKAMKPDDMLILCSDHGNDPIHSGWDHTREHIFGLMTGDQLKKGVDLGTRSTFADIGETVTDLITEGRKKTPIGESMRELILQEDEG